MIFPHKQFYFIRHGETDWNRNRRVMGCVDISLNANGIRQCHEVSLRVQKLKIERIVSSPLIRAKQTAEIINSYLKLPIESHDTLKECCWGCREGQITNDNLFEQWEKGKVFFMGESCLDFKQRVLNAVQTILVSDKVTLIVAHGGVCWAIMHLLNHNNGRIPNVATVLFSPPKTTKDSWSIDLC